MENVMIDTSKIIGGIEKKIADKKEAVIILDKKDRSTLVIKDIILGYYGKKIEVREDENYYHLICRK